MSANDVSEGNDWEHVWNARIAALDPILGKPTDTVYHSLIPFYMGGFADVVPFPLYITGMTYVTAELTGEESDQLPSSLGNYELMICVREEMTQAADMISRLARYTCESVLEAGETMDLPEFFDDSVIKGLLFAHPADQPVQFDLLGQRCGLLLCLGITAEELAFKHANGSRALLQKLKQQGVFPYTVMQRKSVVP